MRWRIQDQSNGRKVDINGDFDEAIHAAIQQGSDGQVSVLALPAKVQMLEIHRNGAVHVKAALSGQEVQRLMRGHHTTIAELAFRMGITQSRIRTVREKGIRGPELVRDWLEGITGVDVGPLPKKYRIRNGSEECQCGFCGYPLYVGDPAYEYVGEAFCSVTCCRRSRRWGS
ncbi:MAG: hypothetical protein DWQ34_25960 [Planctomycetota bacterium]|nr:MAG: hypothetical protein DWQ34_25960 [Planctomycetota bacterium]REK25840.1 MAG: hypothetical protein DWQ41_11005 [Planctomycetota bacterium]REK37119.1 MAG: hypothetical protein DWQ45_07815 [Planctomycetota bacterium]